MNSISARPREVYLNKGFLKFHENTLVLNQESFVKKSSEVYEMHESDICRNHKLRLFEEFLGRGNP